MSVNANIGIYNSLNAVNILGPGNINKIEVWRDDEGTEPDWYCDVIAVHNPVRRQSSYFPVHRWLRTGEVLTLYDRNTFLSQCDPEPEKRRQELERRRAEYPLDKRNQFAMV